MKTKSMNVINNKLYMGNFSLEELANKYTTPLYVYDEEGIRDRLSTYKNSFSDSNLNCITVYATKAFLAPYLVKLLKEYNIYADAVSLGDMWLLKNSGFDMHHVILHGNNKSEEELMYAINNDIMYIVVDNITELMELDEITKNIKKEVKTLFRVNPGVSAHTHDFIQTSRLDSKFGETIFDDKVIDRIMDIYKNNKYLVLDGFHSHIGSQISDEESFIKACKVMGEFLEKTSKKYNVSFNTLDLGGGFGIKYVDSDKEINLDYTLKSIINEAKKFGVKNLMIEPGRSIVGDNCVTLYKACKTKDTYANVSYVFIDGGMGDNIRPSLYNAIYTVCNASCCDGEKKVYNVSGKCCESGDIIVKNCSLTIPKKNDILCCFSTGAYCYSMSMNYNGLPRPAVIFVNKDKVNVAITKEDSKDIFKNCCF